MIHLSTRGRLQNVAAAVTIATMGWLIITEVPPSGGGGGGYARTEYRHYDDTEDKAKKNRERIRQDNETLLIGILKEWVTWQT